MTTRAWTTLGLLVLFSAAAAVARPPVQGPAGTTLEDLADSPTLVTIVLRDTGARDANLQIIALHDTFLSVLTEDDQRVAYLYDSIQEVRVQGGVVERTRFALPDHRPLRAEDQRIVDDAWARIRNVYLTSSDNQEKKIRAATLLAHGNDPDAREYLEMLLASNDLQTQLRAAQALYLVGDAPPQNLLRQGLESGNRRVRGIAAILSGLAGYHDATSMLAAMSRDRMAEIAAPAARALAFLEHRESTPEIMAMLMELNEDKGQAAIFALSYLGGEDVKEMLRARLNDASGQIRFRMIQVLYNLDDPLGRRLMTETFNELPTLAPEAALRLAARKDWDASQFLRDRLARREDPTDYNLRYRARNAAALFASGDPAAQAVFQELMRSDNEEVKDKVSQLIITLGERRLLTLLKAPIQNVDARVALAACEASVALASPDFRERYMKLHGLRAP